MHALDLSIIAIYLATVIAAGFFFGRRQKTTRQFFLAGHGVPWWAVAASIVATETSTVTFISVPGIAYARGGNFTFLQIVFGYLAARVIIATVFMPWYFRGELVTVYELLRDRFGEKVKGLAASLFVVMRTIADGVRLLLTAYVVAAVFQLVPLNVTILILGIVMILFTLIGGIEAVVWIEVAQLAIYIGGAIAAAVLLIRHTGLESAIAFAAAHDKFRVFDFTFDLTRTFGFWSGLIGGTFLTMSTHGTDQYLVQRYLCTDRPRNAAKALLASGVVVLVQFIGFLFIGTLLFAFYRGAAPVSAPDQVFPHFIANHLPPGLSGLVIAAILAAAMSSSLSAIASTVVADLYQPVARNREDRHYLRVSRIVILVAGIAQIGVAIAMQHSGRSALNTVLSIASLINGPILGVFFLGATKRGGPAVALIAMLAGLAAVLAVAFGTPVAWPWYTVVGSLTTLCVGYAVARLRGRAVAAMLTLLILDPATAQPRDLATISEAITSAIAAKKLPGGVLWIEHDGHSETRAYGNRALAPDVEPMTTDTIFDAASITKAVATAPAIWILIDQKKIELDASAKRWLPELGESAITIRHLLTHTSGLRPDVDLDVEWSGHDEGIRRALAETPRNRPGAVFRYSDINYLLLGEIVERISGEPLDVFAKKHVFDPLGMKDTTFNPKPSARIAPTELGLRGTVHDPTARRMGGVAGHAGMFTTASDLAKFARAVLAGRFPRGMTGIQSPPDVAIKRAGGFDVDSAYSRPRGEHFPIGSFGHTGWTGGFFWIDPASRTFYIFLSNRVHPDGKGSVTALQKTLGTLVAESAGITANVPRRVDWVTGGADVLNGIDALHASGYAALRGKRIGLITNPSGIDRAGNPTIDLLRSAPGVTLAALFSPEHGIRGTADAKVADDVISGLPVYSLYGERRKPAREQLANLDALVFDIQDIGTRFYTYISTMGLAMEAAAEAKVPFVVLDRVNPIGGAIVEGPVLEGATNFTGWHTLPIRHGMTVGELAKMFREERGIDVDLTVIPLQRWNRTMWQDDAGLPWTNPSPNMRSLRAAALYPGIGILESAISVGRGTATPFEVIGAPYIDGEVLAREVRVPGVALTPIRFTPDASIHKGESCGGVRIAITDRAALRSVDLGIAIAKTLARLYPRNFPVEKIQPLLRHPLGEGWNHDAFLLRRAKYLLYGNATVLHNVTLVETGAVVDIVIRADRIERVEATHAHPPDAEVIDCSGKFALPGFVEMHAHLLNHPWNEKGDIEPRWDRASVEQMLRLLLAHGITTVRDPGSETEAAVTLRRMLAERKIPGPKLITAGRILIGSDFNPEPFQPVRTAEDIRREIRWQAAAGVDAIKVYSSFTPELLKVAIDEAHAHGLPVIGHLQRTTWTEAARLGIDAIAHAAPWSPEYLSESARAAYQQTMFGRIYWLEHLDLDSPAVLEMADELAKHRVVVDPTLIAMHTKFFGDDPRWLANPDLALVPKKVRDGWPAGSFTKSWTAEQYAAAKRAWPKLLALTRLLYERGVQLSVGTDTPTPWIVPGASFHDELLLLRDAGIPAAAILRMAVRNASIVPGAVADVVIFTKDPRVDLANTRAIAFVFREGVKLGSHLEN